MTQHMYEASKAQISLNNYDSIMILRHNKQSCILSFLLFNLPIEALGIVGESVVLRCGEFSKTLSKIISVQNSNIDFNSALICFPLTSVSGQDSRQY